MNTNAITRSWIINCLLQSQCEELFSVSDAVFLGEAWFERADGALKIGVVPATLGLNADRDKHIGLRVLGPLPRASR